MMISAPSGLRASDRAEPVRTPEPTREQRRRQLEDATYRLERESLERQSMVRGLLLLAIIVLTLSVAAAGVDRVFLHPWW